MSKDETLMLKGVAICLMLWHHLFIGVPQSVIDTGLFFGNFTTFLARYGKICVTMFVFASGLGLAKGAKSYDVINKTLPDFSAIKGYALFVVKRIVKFYFSFWPVFIVMVPIGIWGFDRPYDSIKNLILDFFCLRSSPYNSTWWFNFFILFLYLAFPFFHCILKSKKSSIFFLLGYLIVAYVSKCRFDIGILLNSLPFALGITCVTYEDEINKVIFLPDKLLMLLISGVLVAASVYCSVYNPLYWMEIAIPYCVSTLCVVLFIRIIYRCCPKPGLTKILGIHSGNIYFTHTFIYCYWFSAFIYSFGRPILIFIVLMVISIIISYMFEWIKAITGLNHIQNIIIKNIS